MSEAAAPSDAARPVTPERIMQCAWGYSLPLIIEAAVEEKVFDVLDKKPLTIDELSRETGASVRGLTALANALVAFQFLSKSADGRYALTPESATYLVAGKPAYFGAFFRHVSSQLVPAWLNLKEIVRTGKPPRRVNDEKSGAEFFEQFVEDIFPLSYPAAQALGKSLDLAKSAEPVSVLDIASGSGVWGIALAQQSKLVSVTAVDWPEVLVVTRRVAARFRLDDRFQYSAGDLASADFGKGHQVATLGHILHSEGVARSRSLLARTFAALAPGGTIAIAEFVANDDRTGPPQAMIFAVNMLVNTDAGDAFTFPEISGWLKEAGFANIRRLDAPGPSPLILATKPPEPRGVVAPA